MLLLPNDVKCLGCNRTFCCSKCRQKHEQSAHSTDEILMVKNQQKCDLCNGHPSLNFVLQNDFQFIMHLCESHLPLSCKKCLTQFHSISDFTTNPKCSHLNGGCKLESPLQTKMEKCSHANESDVNYITAMNNPLDIEQNRTNLVSSTLNVEINSTKSKIQLSEQNQVAVAAKYEPNTSDSVISLRNCSTILHTSSYHHTIYRATSPTDTADAIVRKTSTPMHQNMVISDTNTSMMCTSSVSSTSCQVSSIHGSNSSESDTSPVLQESGVNLLQKSVSVGHGKSTSVKRSVRTKLSIAATPLRQVMSKSIQRALREHAVPERYSKSPLDLRMSPVVRRANVENYTPTKRYANRLANASDDTCTPETQTKNRIRRSIELRSGSSLETVYETAKTADIADECDNEINMQNESSSKGKTLATTSKSDAADVTAHLTLMETPVGGSGNGGGLHHGNDDVNGNSNVDVWYTPSENISIKSVDKPDIYTPVLKVPNRSNKRPVLRRNNKIIDSEITLDIDVKDTKSTSPNANSNDNENTNKSGSLWTLVSSVLRFASLKPNDPSDDKTSSDSKSDISEMSLSSPPFIIKRCASFAGVMHKKSITASEFSEIDDLQPNKRRRTSTVNGRISANEEYAIKRRIQGRPPIYRMRNN